MLPTFVIGLREGLEAALIVSIIAGFLRRNGASLRGMWVGLVAAVLLSIGVGVTLHVVEQDLPQAQQEGMETVIGAVAVFFVTGMILWMRTHARFMKRDLESAAETALGNGTTTALTLMVFLAVLREGFETSVFLLSTFSASTSMTTSAAGAVLGLLTAVVIGVGIYSGGVRLNLTRFFKITGVFLVLVAAGLVLSGLRTAHEAGWINVGQGTTLDLSWLAPPGAIRTALVSGVLGIPADPRVIELLGWLCYLVPMLALTLWPAAWKPSTARVPTIRLILAGAMVVLAALLALAVRVPDPEVPSSAPLEGGGSARVTTHGDTGELKVTASDGSRTFALSRPVTVSTAGADTSWRVEKSTSDLPNRLSVTSLLTYTGQRAPVGLDIHRTPGPFAASWREQGSTTLLTRNGGIVDLHSDARLLLTLSGGGLTSPRVVAVQDAGGSAYQVTPRYVMTTRDRIVDTNVIAHDRILWKLWFPFFQVLVAVALLLRNLLRSERRRVVVAAPAQAPSLEADLPRTVLK